MCLQEKLPLAQISFYVQLISYKRFLKCTVYTQSMETIYLSLVHTGSWGTFFMKSPGWFHICKGSWSVHSFNEDYLSIPSAHRYRGILIKGTWSVHSFNGDYLSSLVHISGMKVCFLNTLYTLHFTVSPKKEGFVLKQLLLRICL